MKRLIASTAAKAAAIVLFLLLLGGAVISGLGTLYLSSNGAYDRPVPFAESSLCRRLASYYASAARSSLLELVPGAPDPVKDAGTPLLLGDDARSQLDTLFDPAYTNLRARILDETGALLYGAADVSGLTALSTTHHSFSYQPESEPVKTAPPANTPTADTPTADLAPTPEPDGEAAPAEAETDTEGIGVQATSPVQTDAATQTDYGTADTGAPSGDEELAYFSCTLELYLDPALTAPDAFSLLQPLHERLLRLRFALPVLCLVQLLLCALLYVFLLSAAGHRPGEEQVRRGWVDRIPTDVFYVLSAALGLGCGFLINTIQFYAAVGGRVLSSLIPYLLFFCGGAAGLLLLFLLVSMSTAVRVKTRTWLSSMLVYRALRCLLRGARSAWSGVSAVLHGLPLVWKLLLACGGYVLLSVVLINEAFYSSDLYLLLYLLLSAAGALLLCRYAVGFDRLRRGAQKLAGGDLVCRVETKGMPRGVRTLAEDLGRVSEGAQRALEERMKSERMKTDLITNVSHDLKTPLTSIVNYVELLKKEDLHNGTAEGYVAVLDRQAQRLKKLTEDVVEASKASSGALHVQLAPVDAVELLRQCAAEYGDRFAAAQLTPVLHLPERPLVVLADGRLLWRVFDNLLGNAVKYALPGTRVYLDAAAGTDCATLTLRNISREPLDMRGEELMERFVRGDASRHAEGSGLGLSIAGSLVQLQHGTLTILPDGDLFRAEIRLPLCAAEQPTPEGAPGAGGDAPAPSSDARPAPEQQA